MYKLGRFHTFSVSFCTVAILSVAPIAIAAQTTTTTTTLTPAQQAAKAKADAFAKARADAIAKDRAEAKMRADAFAKAHADAMARSKGTTGATPTAATAATSSVAAPASGTAVQPNATNPGERRHQMWEQMKANTTPANATTVAQPATAATAGTTATPTTTPSQGSFLSRFMNNNGNAGSAATPQGNGFTSSSSTSAGRTAGNNTFAAGLGRFTSGNQSAVLYGCLRSGTRVFCDYDEFSSNVTQANANWGATLVIAGGRTIAQHSATYVDPDGNSFPTGELNPNTGVRMMVEYDDVPESVTSASMVLGQNRIQNVPIAPLNVQANGNLAPRNLGYNQVPGNSAGTVQQTGAGNGAGLMGSANQVQTNATGAMQNAQDKVNNGTQTINNTKQKMGSIWNQIKSATATKPQ